MDLSGVCWFCFGYRKKTVRLMGKSVSSVSSTICVASFWTEPCFGKSYKSYKDLRKYHRIPYMEHVGIVASRCLDVWMLGFICDHSNPLFYTMCKSTPTNCMPSFTGSPILVWGDMYTCSIDQYSIYIYVYIHILLYIVCIYSTKKKHCIRYYV
jgi:hypothetical protein